MISPKIRKIGFEDVKNAILASAHFVLINTLLPTRQDCLIKNTIHSQQEEAYINELLFDNRQKTKSIIVYGMNALDDTCERKCRQLCSLGFLEVSWYVGGLFEWALLQDIYGETEFPTTKRIVDPLNYKAHYKVVVK